MLVLTRKKDQKIIIGDQTITLTVLQINEHNVRLGIDAPQSCDIYREELLERIKRNGNTLKNASQR